MRERQMNRNQLNSAYPRESQQTTQFGHRNYTMPTTPKLDWGRCHREGREDPLRRSQWDEITGAPLQQHHVLTFNGKTFDQRWTTESHAQLEVGVGWRPTNSLVLLFWSEICAHQSQGVSRPPNCLGRGAQGSHRCCRGLHGHRKTLELCRLARCSWQGLWNFWGFDSTRSSNSWGGREWDAPCFPEGTRGAEYSWKGHGKWGYIVASRKGMAIEGELSLPNLEDNECNSQNGHTRQEKRARFEESNVHEERSDSTGLSAAAMTKGATTTQNGSESSIDDAATTREGSD